MQKTASLVPLVVVAAGLLFSLYLVRQVPDEVFFNGDGGVKLLVAKQFLAGYWGTDIRPPDDPFIRELWRQGYVPFDRPFVYEIGGRYVQCFPVFFSLLTAPFYGLLGFRGLYVVPLIGLWVVWGRFWFVCRRMALGPLETTVGLFALLFASPLTIYGATYWEHTLAAALAFCGIAEMVSLSDIKPPAWRALAAGALLGLAGWFRPENLCFAAAALAAWFIPCWLTDRLRGWLMAGLAGAVMIGAFLAFNQAVYGHPFGAHSFSVLQDKTFADHLRNESLPLAWTLNFRLLRFMPVALFAVLASVLVLLRRSAGLPRRLGFLLGTLLIHSLLVPLIVDHQGGFEWGPRYLLSSVPVVALIVVLAVHAFLGERPNEPMRLHVVGLLLLLVLLLFSGFYVNTVEGKESLTTNYHARVLPALRLLRERQERFVVVDHQYIAQELAAAWDQHYFLRVQETGQFLTLAAALRRHGAREFLFMTQADAGQPPAALIEQNDAVRIQGRLLGVYGSYAVYEASTLQ